MRSINVVAKPRLPLQERLQECADFSKQPGLPMMFQLTPLCLEDGLFDITTAVEHGATDGYLQVELSNHAA